jgi:hypothetical protein
MIGRARVQFFDAVKKMAKESELATDDPGAESRQTNERKPIAFAGVTPDLVVRADTATAPQLTYHSLRRQDWSR